MVLLPFHPRVWSPLWNAIGSADPVLGSVGRNTYMDSPESVRLEEFESQESNT